VAPRKVAGITPNPTFTYSSKLDYSGLPNGEKLEIAPGSNNPVGVVWIDLGKPGYGIHGRRIPRRSARRPPTAVSG
jgi:hypothetical protein